MSFEGMDVDQLQGLAEQIDSDAQALYNLVNSLNGAIGALTFIWQGAVAAAFDQDWQFKNRPALLAAHTTLTNLHGHLVSNINQQQSASAAEGGWTAGRVINDLENVLKGGDLIKKGLKFSSKTADFLDHTPIGHALPVLDYVTMGIGLYHMGKDMYAASEDLEDGQYGNAAYDYVDGLSEGLKGVSGPIMEADPLVGLAVYGVGVELKFDDELAKEAASIDWKDTPNPLIGNNWETIYEPELRSGAFWEQAGKQAGTMLWDAL